MKEKTEHAINSFAARQEARVRFLVSLVGMTDYHTEHAGVQIFKNQEISPERMKENFRQISEDTKKDIDLTLAELEAVPGDSKS